MTQDRRVRESREYDVPSAREWAKQHDVMGATSLRIPDGTSLFTIKKEGNYRIDVIPYVVGKGNPHAAEGKKYWQRTYFVHRGVGANGQSFCCPKKCTDGRLKCPICEDAWRQWNAIGKDRELTDEELKKEKDRVKALWPKERQLFAVIDKNNAEKGIQIWDQSFHLFGKALKNKLDNMDEVDEKKGYDRFHHPEMGYTIRITAVEEKMGSYSFFDCSIFEFREREPYEMSIIDEAPCLDDAIILLTYEQLEKAYYGTVEAAAGAGDDGQGPVKQEARRGRPPKEKTPDKTHDRAPEKVQDKAKERPAERRAEEPAGGPTAHDLGITVDSVVIYKHALCEVQGISKDGTTLTLVDADDEQYRAVPVSQVRPRTPKSGEAPKPVEAKEEQVRPSPARPSRFDDDDDDAPPPRGNGRLSARRAVADDED